MFFQNEVEQSTYALRRSPNAPKLFEQFAFFEGEAKRLLEAKLPLPGYEMILKAAHTFNLLDARGAISVTERAGLHRPHPQRSSRLVATAYVESREALGFPMLAERERRMPAQYAKARHDDRQRCSSSSFTEELPPKALKRLGEAFAEALAAGLRERGFLADDVRVTPYATPRRLAVSITDVLAHVARPAGSGRSCCR